MARESAIRVGLAVYACCMTGIAQAELTITPSLAPSVLVDDNRLLRSDDANGLAATVTRMGLEAAYARPTYAVSLEPELTVRRHTSHKELDFNDVSVALKAEKVFERHRFELGFDFDRKSSATTELADIGVIDSAVSRVTLDFSSRWEYAVSERVSFSSFGGITDVTFGNGGAARLIDYRVSNAGMDARATLTERTSLIGVAALSLFETPALRSKTLSYSFQLGLASALTETVDMQFLLGQNIGFGTVRSLQSIPVSVAPLTFATRRITQSTRLNGQIINTRVAKRISRGRFEVEWNRIFTPSSLGSRQKRQVIDLDASYDLDDRWTTGVRVEYREQRQESDVFGSIRPTNQVIVNASLRYRINPRVMAVAAYRFRYREQVDLRDIAVSNRILLELQYRGDPIELPGGW